MVLNGSLANTTTSVGIGNVPTQNLVGVSGSGMTVCQNGLSLGVIYDGAFTTSTPNAGRILEAQWMSTTSAVYVVANSSNGLTATAYANGYTGQWATLMVRLRNCAGWSGWQQFQVYVCSGPSGWRFAYGPNPGQETLTISAQPTAGRTTATDPDGAAAKELPTRFSAVLFNSLGEPVAQGQANELGQVVLNLRGLPRGTYFLHLFDAEGKLLEKRQIQVGPPLSN
ncbi:MAG: T9SS type A sorting domain-containing protein [Bernardetiaceae bacterium]|nr:T9SS type A sorting domain-containing protein [Bernardetiaceae bacterium]